MNKELISRVALSLIPGIGNVFAKKLIAHSGSAEEVFKSNKSTLLKIPGLGDKLAQSLSNSDKYIISAEQQISKSLKDGIDIICYNEPDYPTNLKQIHDSPFLVFYKGDKSCFYKKNIAIVGTRNATDYGREMTQEIVKNLRGLNCNIISGLAYGIDIEAHKTALDHNISTIGVMANGIDKVYPNVHSKIANNMTTSGGLLSEYPLGSEPEQKKFPARNRIIAGLSDVTIVIEAATKGGALITAEMANDYSREVFAVPGNIGNMYSAGCNKLIQQNKAHIFTDIDSFLNIMNWKLGKSNQLNIPNFIDVTSLTSDPIKKRVLKCISENEGIQLDVLSWQSETTLSKLVMILLELELDGLIIGLPGNAYKINNKNIAKQIKQELNG